MNKEEKEKYFKHEKLIERCRRGDRRAQFEIYKLYYKAMFNSCLRIVNNSVEAEDLMQESFLKAFNKIETYKGEVAFGAWLKKIVVNNALDYVKKRKLQLIELNEAVTCDFYEDDNQISDDVSVESIKEKIKELPDGYRVILSLYLFEGYDHEEIASILNISNSTSRSQYLRAKQRLIKELNNKE